MSDPDSSDRTDRMIGCRDAVGRRCQVIVFGDRCGVVLVAPAGETAVLSAAEVGSLHAALDAAVTEHQSVNRRE
jgi:hypothetical protein